MLAWEFAPHQSGGLGKASQALSQALAPLANLTLVLPQSPATPPPNTFEEVIGLDQYEQQYGLENPLPELAAPLEALHQVPVWLSPYEAAQPTNATAAAPTTFSQLAQPASTPPSLVNNPMPLYEGNLHERVMRYAKYAKAIAANTAFDLIHAHDWMTWVAAAEIKATSGKPMVLHVHSLEYDRSQSTQNWIYQLEKETLQQANMVLAVSHYTAQVLEQHYGIAPHKIRVAHNAITPQAPQRFTTPFNEPLVVFAGRVTQQKGAAYFLHIIERVLAQYQPVRFVIAGTGNLLKNLVEKSASSTAAPYVHFTGYLPPTQIHKLLGMATVYCMPSVSEPFGLTALEAVQQGAATVVSDQCGVKELIPSLPSAPYWNTNEMAAHICQLLEQPLETLKLVARQQAILNDVSWVPTANSVALYYQQVLNPETAQA